MEEVSIPGLDVGLHPRLPAVSRFGRRTLERITTRILVVNAVADSIARGRSLAASHLLELLVFVLVALAGQDVGLDTRPLPLWRTLHEWPGSAGDDWSP